MFSQRFGYATHALAYIAKKPLGTLVTLPELAGWIRSLWPGASNTYLSNVVQRLARGGVLRGHRGIGGGYSLTRPPEQITLRDLAEILEGASLEKCGLSLGPNCPVVGRCHIQRTVRQIEEQYLQSLAKITLAEIAAGVSIKLPQETKADDNAGGRGRRRTKLPRADE
jgi:Rrf2 family nitric oxide-sensitive transcriptional repressor